MLSITLSLHSCKKKNLPMFPPPQCTVQDEKLQPLKIKNQGLVQCCVLFMLCTPVSLSQTLSLLFYTIEVCITSSSSFPASSVISVSLSEGSFTLFCLLKAFSFQSHVHPRKHSHKEFTFTNFRDRHEKSVKAKAKQKKRGGGLSFYYSGDPEREQKKKSKPSRSTSPRSTASRTNLPKFSNEV